MKSNSGPKNEQTIPGKIYRSTGSHYKVRTETGEMIDAVLRGKFRLGNSKSTNPICVGDDVELVNENESWAIVKLHPRKNYIPRKSVNLSSRLQVLCANVDQALVLFTTEHPVTTLGYIDRILATCEGYDVPPVILFNKTDLLLTDEEKKKLEDFVALYSTIGYPCHLLCATDPKYKEKIIELMRDKSSFVVGRSGAGKSSLINLAEPGLKLKVGIVSDFSGRGKHTTTFAELHELSFGGAVIDMPGFKEMEVWGMERTALDQCFPEMAAHANSCRFSDCLHVNEPGCTVVAAVENGDIATSRYYSYVGMLDELDRNEKEHWLGPG